MFDTSDQTEGGSAAQILASAEPALDPSGDRVVPIGSAAGSGASPKVRAGASKNSQRSSPAVRTCRKPKKLTVGYMKTDEAGVDVPYLRLRGQWLHRAGFTIGRTLKLEISEGKLLIEACE
jgi:hypothetical protein